MAHMTKVNGTAYEIVGGSTKVNGTDYDIIKGKTKVGGTDYDIEFDTNSFNWVGWNNATWQDIVNLCKAKRDGVIDSFPSDVYVQRGKYLAMLKSTSSYTAGSYYAYLVRVKENSLVFLWYMPKTPSSWKDFSSPIGYIQSLNDTTALTEIDDAMIIRPQHIIYYRSGGWNASRTLPAGRFFCPRLGEWIANGTLPYYADNQDMYPSDGSLGAKKSLAFPSGLVSGTWGAFSGGNGSDHSYGRLSNGSYGYYNYPSYGTAQTWNFCPCFEVGGGS